MLGAKSHFCFPFQSAASKTLLAVLESRRDGELADRILQKISSPDDEWQLFMKINAPFHNKLSGGYLVLFSVCSF